jgi:hypothetical protein
LLSVKDVEQYFRLTNAPADSIGVWREDELKEYGAMIAAAYPQSGCLTAAAWWWLRSPALTAALPPAMARLEETVILSVASAAASAAFAPLYGWI